MSGIRTGSRLQQLYALRARLDLEIAAEVRRDPLAAGVRPAEHPRRNSPAMDRIAERLTELGTNSLAVKRWAFAQGLIPAIVRGRVPLELIERYAVAHGLTEEAL